MSKVILVMDMPTDCEDCPLFKDGDKGERECKAKSTGTEWDYYKVRPNWCPLREVPQQREEKMASDVGLRDCGFIDGWNACIDEILEGKV